MPGPAPTPTALLRLRGSWRAKTRPQEPGLMLSAAPECPDWLDGEARAVWQDLVPELAALGLATALDECALGRYCVLFTRWKKVDALCQQDVGTAADRRRIERLCRGISDELFKLEKQFGMTPASRVRLGLPPGGSLTE